jgi:hypothetical protein
MYKINFLPKETYFLAPLHRLVTSGWPENSSCLTLVPNKNNNVRVYHQQPLHISSLFIKATSFDPWAIISVHTWFTTSGVGKQNWLDLYECAFLLAAA